MMALKARPVLLSFVLAAGMAGYYFHIFLPRARATRAAHNIHAPYAEDMYPYWFGTRELLRYGHSPYTDRATQEIQNALYGRILDPTNPYERDQHRFSYPLYVTLLLAPFAWLPFWVLRACAAVTFPLLVVLGTVLWSRAMRLKLMPAQLIIICVLALCSYSLLDALVTQQLSLVVFFALALAVWLLVHRRLGWSGLVLALATIKPQLVILPILFLLLWALSRWRERRNLALSLALSTAVLLGISLLLMPSWPIEWWNTIVSYRQYTVPPLAPYILGKVPGTFLTVVLLALTTWVSWQSRCEESDSIRFASCAALILAVTVVSIPMGNAVYDHVLILPAILLLVSQGRSIWRGSVMMRVLLGTCVAVFAWQWVCASVVVFAEFVWPKLITSGGVLSAPLRTQPSMPFAVLALLALRMVDSFKGLRPRPALS
jgi:hypothetical protein